MNPPLCEIQRLLRLPLGLVIFACDGVLINSEPAAGNSPSERPSPSRCMTASVSPFGVVEQRIEPRPVYGSAGADLGEYLDGTACVSRMGWPATS